MMMEELKFDELNDKKVQNQSVEPFELLQKEAWLFHCLLQ